MTRTSLALAGWLLVACGDDGSSRPSDDAGDGDGQDAGDDDSGADAGDDAGPDEDGGSDDADAGDGARTAEACFADLAQSSAPWLDIQRFKSGDGAITLWRAREVSDGPTVGETTAYALVRFWIASPDEPGTCVRDRSAMTYSYAHHNWMEVWTARTPHALYEGHEDFQLEWSEPANAWKDTLTVKDAAGSTLLGPIELVPDGCSSIPYDLNPCSLRTRVDQPPPGWGED